MLSVIESGLCRITSMLRIYTETTQKLRCVDVKDTHIHKHSFNTFNICYPSVLTACVTSWMFYFKPTTNHMLYYMGHSVNSATISVSHQTVRQLYLQKSKVRGVSVLSFKYETLLITVAANHKHSHTFCLWQMMINVYAFASICSCVSVIMLWMCGSIGDGYI